MSADRPVAVLGASGYVGSAIVAELGRRGMPVRPVSRSECDLYDREALRRSLREISPAWVINAAGYTGKPNVDACEDAKAECLRANAVLPGIVVDVCREEAIRWGHVSSGCIYSGARSDGMGFKEEDSPNFCFRAENCSFYSGTKALGEEVIGEADSGYVWRLRIPFSERDSSRNYLSKVMRYERLLDVRNSLSDLNEFAAACVDCFVKEVPFGVYNLTNTGSLTTREVVELIREAKLVEKTFRYFASEAEFMRTAARAPRSHCVLDNSKARLAGLDLTDVEVAVRRALSRWQWEDS